MCILLREEQTSSIFLQFDNRLDTNCRDLIKTCAIILSCRWSKEWKMLKVKCTLHYAVLTVGVYEAKCIIQRKKKCGPNSDPIYSATYNGEWGLDEHSHWIQLKAFSSSSHADKCIVHRTLKKQPFSLLTIRASNTSVQMFGWGDAFQMPYALPCIHYVLFELQAVFFLSSTFERSVFMFFQMGGKEASVTFTMRYFMIFWKAKRTEFSYYDEILVPHKKKQPNLV